MYIEKAIIENGIYGLAIGDALGVPHEGLPRAYLKKHPCTDMTGYGSWNQPAGTYSDDTALTLATMDTLRNVWLKNNYEAVMCAFYRWCYADAYSVDETFDVGGATRRAIDRFVQRCPQETWGGRDINDNGNGSLMRILPAVLFSLAQYECINEDFLCKISSLTHAHKISINACILYGYIVENLIKTHKLEWGHLKERFRGEHEFDRLFADDFISLPEEKIQSSGYVVTTLEAALWCLKNTDTYKNCVLKAINLGHDTDTVASVAGGLAGLLYGKESIPKAWVEQLRNREFIDKRIVDFANLLSRICGPLCLAHWLS